jgi:hypothetical protein
VLVCFCTNTYFNSEYCANEFEVFRQRVIASGAADSYPVIIPVVWNVCTMPRAMSKYQSSHEAAGFPSDYRLQGLLALQRSRNYKSRARFEAAISALTAVIQEAVSGKPLPPLARPVVFDSLPGVFDNPGAYNVRVGALHDDGLRWILAPETGSSVRRIVEAVSAVERLPWRAFKVADDLGAQLEMSAAAREAVVLVADAASLSEPDWQLRTAVVDAVSLTNFRVLLGLQREDIGTPIAPELAEQRLAAALPNLAATGRAAWFDVSVPEMLEARLTEQIIKLRMALVAEDPAERVEDSVLAGGALEKGIAVATQPMVTGPRSARP